MKKLLTWMSTLLLAIILPSACTLPWMQEEDEFDITIPAVEIVPENFNSAEAMWALITRLMEE